MKKSFLAVVQTLFTIFLFSCGSNGDRISELKGVFSNTDAIVVNSLAETFSAVYKGSPREIVNNIKDSKGNILNTGSAPNQFLVKKGLGFVLNSLSNNIQVIDLENLRTLNEISLGTNSSPYFMSFSDDNTIYVSCLFGDDGNGQVKVVNVDDAGNLTLKAAITMPKGDELEPFEGKAPLAKPQGIVFSSNKIYVTLTNLDGWAPGGPGLVVIIDPETNTIIKKIRTNGLNASYAYVSEYLPDRVYILHSGTFIGDGSMDVIDSTTDEIVSSLNTGGAPYSMVITKDKKGYVTDALGPHLFSFNADSGDIINDSSNPIPVVDPAKAPFNFISYIDVNKDGLLFALAFNSDELYILEPYEAKIVEGPYLLGDGPITMVVDK